MKDKHSMRSLFSVLFSVTLMLLIYVHIQAEIFRLSYSIEKKERELAELSERYKVMHFSVTQLKSPNYLNEQMKKKSIELITPKTAEIIKVPMPKNFPLPEEPAVSPVKAQLLSWAGFMKEAQAKPSNSR